MLFRLIFIAFVLKLIDGNIRLSLTKRITPLHHRRLSNILPLGVGFGTHYAEIFVGTPPQKASVIVDTGSHLTAFPCAQCKDCGKHTDDYFNVSKSSTAVYVPCESDFCSTCDNDKNHCIFKQDYFERSGWEATMVEDVCWLGNLTGTNMEQGHYGIRYPFGCQYAETGLFITQKENGIMGMSADSRSYIEHLYREQKITKHMFSLCFGKTAGLLEFGSYSTNSHISNVTFLPMKISNAGLYYVKVLDILIGNKSIGLAVDDINSGSGVIVDTGTTDSYFVKEGKDAFNREFQRQTGFQYNDETSIALLDKQNLQNLPNITMIVEGFDGIIFPLIVRPENYIAFEKNNAIGTFHFSEGSGGVIGANSITNKNVIFDIENKQIGFAEAKCDMTVDTSGSEQIPPTPPPSTTTKTKTDEQSQHSYALTVIIICAILAVGIIAYNLYKKSTSDQWSALEQMEPEDLEAPGSIGGSASPLNAQENEENNDDREP